MCPDIRLYDFRVLGKTLEDTEFAIIAALQYIRYVNERHNYITDSRRQSEPVHSAQRSQLRLRTHAGLQRMRAARGQRRGGGRGRRQPRLSELRDQGRNVRELRRVQHHRSWQRRTGSSRSARRMGDWPHTYGVSFFSSRGPTGDGRLKPDLVAPGERVQSTVPKPRSGARNPAPAWRRRMSAGPRRCCWRAIQS